MRLSELEIGHFPKVELHLHLDCSLSFDVVQKLDPSISFENYQSNFIAPSKCSDLNDYLDKASSALELMQTKDQLTSVTKDLYQQLNADNVIYSEIRFAPLLHTRKGLSPEEVVETVLETASICQKKFDIPGGIILCTLRHFKQMQSIETIKLVDKYIDKGVVGFDIASDEAGHPIDAHLKAFQYAKDLNIPCTAHAGEAKGAESVWETLKSFYPRRIGHGVRSEEDESLIDYLKDNGIHLEICPTSNVQTGVFPDIVHHNIDRLYQKDISLSINTDGRTISNTTCSYEYFKLAQAFSWGTEHYLKCNLEAINAAFTTEQIKATIIDKLHNGYKI